MWMHRYKGTQRVAKGLTKGQKAPVAQSQTALPPAPTFDPGPQSTIVPQTAIAPQTAVPQITVSGPQIPPEQYRLRENSVLLGSTTGLVFTRVKDTVSRKSLSRTLRFQLTRRLFLELRLAEVNSQHTFPRAARVPRISRPPGPTWTARIEPLY